MVKFYAALSKALVDNGVSTLFGLAGDANLYFIDHFAREADCSYISAVHEGSAMVMALGYASATGKLGVATVTHGPGLSNTVTALIEGVKGRIPALLVCGDTAVEDRHHTQNISQRDVILSSGAGFEQVRAAHTLCEDVATAIHRAWVERRPIALNIPIDLQWQDVAYKAIVARAPLSTGATPTGQSFDEAVGIIASAKRPIVLAGRGATTVEARDALVRLAHRLQAPLATTLKAQGLFQGMPGNLGVFGTLSTPPAVEAILESDCVIAFGAGLNAYTTAKGAYLTKKRVVQCTAEPGEIGRLFRPDAALWGDPVATADAIVHWLNVIDTEPSGFLGDALAARLRRYSPEADIGSSDTPPGTVDMRKALWRIQQVMPANFLFASDAGRFCSMAFRTIAVSEPLSFVYGLHSGSIGLGMAHAIGAGCSDRSKTVLHITGDGGFMLGGLGEFNTAVRQALDMVVVVCNDGAYGAEHVQLRNKDMDPGISMFSWPDFAPVAQALGGVGVTVRGDADLESALHAIVTRDRGRPLLIDLKLHPDHMPTAR